MRVPFSRAYGSLRTVVRRRSSSYDLQRPDETMDGRFGEHDDATVTTVSGVDVWLFEPEEVNLDTEHGDRLQGDLNGLSLPSADVQVHDRVTHGGDVYEVDDIAHLPDNDNQQLKAFSLTKRVNDA